MSVQELVLCSAGILPRAPRVRERGAMADVEHMAVARLPLRGSPPHQSYSAWPSTSMRKVVDGSPVIKARASHRRSPALGLTAGWPGPASGCGRCPGCLMLVGAGARTAAKGTGTWAARLTARRRVRGGATAMLDRSARRVVAPQGERGGGGGLAVQRADGRARSVRRRWLTRQAAQPPCRGNGCFLTLFCFASDTRRPLVRVDRDSGGPLVAERRREG